MTTNETSFFRDSQPFELLFKIVLPHLARARATQRRLRIWSAACSSGQEAYSILMGLDQRVPQLNGWHIELVATDLSETVLERARAGVFNHFEVQRGLPAPYLIKYFDRKGRNYKLKSELTDRVQFKPLNLLRPFAHLGTFDVVFCRNVLIYFDDDTKKDILDRQLGVLARDGFLFLGGGEPALGITESLRRLQTPEGIVYCNAATDPAEVDLVQA